MAGLCNKTAKTLSKYTTDIEIARERSKAAAGVGAPTTEPPSRMAANRTRAGSNNPGAPTGGRDTLAGLDRIVHDPTQLTLGSFERGSRGPYPSHPFGGDP
jgi:hypothetical protein